MELLDRAELFNLIADTPLLTKPPTGGSPFRRATAPGIDVPLDPAPRQGRGTTRVPGGVHVAPKVGGEADRRGRVRELRRTESQYEGPGNGNDERQDSGADKAADQRGGKGRAQLAADQVGSGVHAQSGWGEQLLDPPADLVVARGHQGARRLSFNEAPEWEPSVLDDGRLIYTRWDYINRHDTVYQSLWTLRPDGTGTAHFWGNQSVWPDHVSEPRPIPGSRSSPSP